jgi:hypothetical protein
MTDGQVSQRRAGKGRREVLAAYRGPGQFGPAYRVLFERDAHAPRTVDRVLLERMVRLCPATVRSLYGQGGRAYTPTMVRYVRGSRPALEATLARVTAGGG